MQKNGGPLIASFRQTPSGRLDIAVEVEILSGRLGLGRRIWIKPTRSVEPVNVFITSCTDAVYDVLSCMFQLAAERSHDENWDGRRDRVGDVDGIA